MMIRIIETTDEKNVGLVIDVTEEIYLASDFVFKNYQTKEQDGYIILFNDNYIIKGITI